MIKKVSNNVRVLWEEGVAIKPFTIEVYNTRHDYIGAAYKNNSSVITLKMANSIGGFTDELQTSKEPYGWNIIMEDEITKQIIKGNHQIDYQALSNQVKQKIESANSNIEDTSSNHLSYVLIEFYALIAMTCLYGGVVSMEAMNQSLPDMASKGKRISVSPTNKFTIVLSSLLASYIVQLIGVFLLFAFLLFVLKIDFGSHILLCILLSIIGSLAGLSIGLFVSTVLKTNENTKVGIIISISMVYSFLSGMMGITMKYIIDKNVPLLNQINPANMITDGFYSLYYYNTLDRYIGNIISLVIFSVILLTISGLVLRRQKYDSI